MSILGKICLKQLQSMIIFIESLFMRSNSLPLPLLVGILSSLLLSGGSAQTVNTWITETNTTENALVWSQSGKWVGGVSPVPGSGAMELDFSGLTVARSGSTYYRNDIAGSGGASFDVSKWRLANATSATVYGILSGAAPIRFVAAGGANPEMIHQQGAGLQQFQFISTAQIVGEATVLQLTGAATGRLSFATTTLSGEGGIHLNKSAGDAIFRDLNTFTGDFTLGAGTLTLTASSAGPVNNVTNGPLGRGAVVLHGGLLRAEGAERTLGNRVRITGNLQIGDAGAHSKNIVLQGETLLAGNGVTRTITGGFAGATAGDQNRLTFAGAISDEGHGNSLAFALGASATQVTLSGANSYTGDTIVDGGAGTLMTLSSTGSLKFVIGADGVNNRLRGSGRVELEGAFILDLAGSTHAPGQSWTLVDTSTLSVTWGSAFEVVDFTQLGAGLWSRSEGATTYTFDQSTGRLVTSVVPEPSAVMLGLGGLIVVALLRRRVG